MMLSCRMKIGRNSGWLMLCTISMLPACLPATCVDRELRGKSTPSEDGRTYLVIAESPGCPTFDVDGLPWPHALGERGPVSPGVRSISCSGESAVEIQFEVKQGGTFRFDYWGP
jgi:hypothetical protein